MITMTCLMGEDAPVSIDPMRLGALGIWENEPLHAVSSATAISTALLFIAVRLLLRLRQPLYFVPLKRDLLLLAGTGNQPDSRTGVTMPLTQDASRNRLHWDQKCDEYQAAH